MYFEIFIDVLHLDVRGMLTRHTAMHMVLQAHGLFWHSCECFSVHAPKRDPTPHKTFSYLQKVVFQEAIL